MPPRRSSKLPSTATLEADRTTLRAVKLLPDYAPLNSDISLTALSDLEARLKQAEEVAFQADNAQVIARNAYVAVNWEMHDAIQRVKAAVISQYGASSNAVQAIGLKKKSDYRRPTRRNTSAV